MRAILSMLVFVAACSSSGSATTVDAGSKCPSSPPTNGSPCSFTSGPTNCEYGGDARGACVTSAECAQDSGTTAPTWHVVTPAPGCGTNGSKCDTSYGTAEGKACDSKDIGLTCDYDQGRCGCLLCSLSTPGLGAYWHCRKWTDVAAGCPTPRPLAGTACTTAGLQCDYNRCCTGPSLGRPLECTGGAWKSYVDTACSCVAPKCP